MATAPALDPLTKQAFLEDLAHGFGKTHACQRAGITLSTLRRELLKDQDFAESVEMILQRKVEQVEEALYQRAVGDENHQGNVQAMQFFLTNRSKDWANTQRVEHTGKDGGPVLVAHAATESLLAALRDRELQGSALDFVEGELLEEAIVEADVLEIEAPGGAGPTG